MQVEKALSLRLLTRAPSLRMGASQLRRAVILLLRSSRYFLSSTLFPLAQQQHAAVPLFGFSTTESMLCALCAVDAVLECYSSGASSCSVPPSPTDPASPMYEAAASPSPHFSPASPQSPSPLTAPLPAVDSLSSITCTNVNYSTTSSAVSSSSATASNSLGLCPGSLQQLFSSAQFALSSVHEFCTGVTAAFSPLPLPVPPLAALAGCEWIALYCCLLAPVVLSDDWVKVSPGQKSFEKNYSLPLSK